MRIMSLFPALVAIALVLAVPLLDRQREVTRAELLRIMPPSISDCRPEDPEHSPYWSELNGVDQRLQLLYSCDGDLFQIDLARYVAQGPNKEAISDSNRIIDTRYVSAALQSTVPVAHGLSFREYRIDRGIGPGLLWTTYAVDGTGDPHEFSAKLRDAWSDLLHPGETAIVTLTVWTDDYDAARRVLRKRAPEIWAWYLTEREAARATDVL
jgi:hypothetical protein